MANDLHSRSKALHKQKDSAGVLKENGYDIVVFVNSVYNTPFSKGYIYIYS